MRTTLPRRVTRRRRMTRHLYIETLERRQLLAADVLTAASPDLSGPAQDVNGDELQPPPPPLAQVHGVKWQDLNGNGRREQDEAGLPGVIIYSDLDGNGRFSEGEPTAVSMRDDPNTRVDETGRYWLTDLDFGPQVIREVQPDGFRQTFPGPKTEIHDLARQLFAPGVAQQFQLTEVGSSVNDDGSADLELTFTVVWPDSCGSLIHDVTPTVTDGRIFVPLLGEQVGEACLTVITPETQTVHVGPLKPGEYQLSSILHEDLRSGFFHPTRGLSALIGVGSGGAHFLELHPGDVAEGINFGNQPFEGGGSIHGVKWLDKNGNAQRDSDEPGSRASPSIWTSTTTASSTTTNLTP